MKRFLPFFLLLCSCAGLCASPVPLTDPAQTYDLFRASSLLEVPPGQVSINALIQPPNRFPFRPTRNELIHPNDHQKAYWFKVEVNNQTPEAFFLHFVYSGTERITIYEVADNKVIATGSIGRLDTNSLANFRHSKLFWPMQVRQGATAQQKTHTLYIYMEGIYTTCLYFDARSAVNLLGMVHSEDLFYGLYYGFILMIVVYSILLFIRLRERETIRYGIWVMSMGLQLALYRGFTAEFLWPGHPSFEQYGSTIAGATGLLHVLFTISFLKLPRHEPLFYRLGLTIIAAYVLGMVLFVVSTYTGGTTGKTIDVVPVIALVEGLFSVVVGIVAYRRGFKPALYYVIGNLVFFASIFIFLQYASGRLPHTFWSYNSIHIGSGIEIILFTIGLVYKINLLKRGQEEAVREQLRLAEMNRQLIEKQNVLLEGKVRERTDELNVQKEGLQTTLLKLQATQAQLIHKEKMASLGELVAGIAHEIQNPLNFVNNFSEISVELLGELKEELEADRKADALKLIDDLVPSLQKITHHGKRADSIVRSMLQHSRNTTGFREPTDLNALAGEYLQLAYQGLRAKDKTFNARLTTDFDPRIGLVELVPQEITRVLLNLYSNAFYATHEKAQKLPASQSADYNPEVTVSTRLDDGMVVLRVRDNGVGIPPDLLGKIYQPFFTTKPSGQGIGLGLSLSYDIITKSHNGQFDVQTEPGLFTEFTIRLPQTVSEAEGVAEVS